MSGSAISILYLVFLGILFVLLIVMTVTLIVSKKKKDDEYDEEDEFFDDLEKESEEDEYEEEESEASYNVEEDSALSDSAFTDSAFTDSAFGDSAFTDSAFTDSAFGDSAFADSAFADSAFVDAPKTEVVEEKPEQPVKKVSLPQDTTQKLPQQEVKEEIKKQRQEAKQLEASDESEEQLDSDMIKMNEMPAEQVMVEEAIASTGQAMYEEPEVPVQQAMYQEPEVPVQQPMYEEPVVPEDQMMYAQPETQYENNVFGDSAFGDSAFDDDSMDDSAFTDSAFVDTGIPVLSDEAIQASVREAEAMGAAVTGMTGSLVDVTAAIAEKEKAPVKKHGRGHGKQYNYNVTYAKPTDDFFWFNKVDAAERPSYKTIDMYYHHFNLPKDCIEDLLIEMYDCGLVRTEEIRYIAYGIEPRAVSIKEILTSGNSNYVKQVKKKEPTTQDLVNIYEKWCGYVDKLFDIIEMHADESTYKQIRHMLYEYGRSDVDILIEGK